MKRKALPLLLIATFGVAFGASQPQACEDGIVATNVERNTEYSPKAEELEKAINNKSTQDIIDKVKNMSEEQYQKFLNGLDSVLDKVNGTTKEQKTQEEED